MRVVNWFFHATASVVVGLATSRVDFVLVPISEIPCTTLPAVIVAAIKGVPLIAINLNVRGQYLWRFNRLLHKRAAAIVTISRALARDIRAELPDARIDVIPLGIDDASVERQKAVWDGIFVGRHVAEKGIVELLAIWELCLQKRSGLRLALVGPVEPKMRQFLAAEIDRRGLRDAVHIFGPVDETAKWQLYAAARVCCFPSRVEGFGFVPIEAHLAGLPVVAYRLDAYDENIAESADATLVECGDHAAFADAILGYLDRDFDAARATEWAKQFRWREAVPEAEHVLLRILDAR